MNFDKSTIKTTRQDKTNEKQESITDIPTKLAAKLPLEQQAKLERSKKHLNASEKYYNGGVVEGSEGDLEKQE